MAPASMPSAISHRSASLSLSAILLARSTVLEKAASKVSAIGSMGRSIGIGARMRKASIAPTAAYVQRSVLLELQTVDMQRARAGGSALEQRDVGDVHHVHEPMPGPVADIFERDAQRAAFAGRELEAFVVAVAER